MSDESWIEEEKTLDLMIPGIALPGLRDLKILFIAIIVWDTFLGPVTSVKEISRGSSYISKIKDHRTIAEVYAGVARSDLETLTQLEDEIVVSRYLPEGKEDVTTVLLISCIPGSDLDPVRELGSAALVRSQGDPDLLGLELSKYLRETLYSKTKYVDVEQKRKILILDGNRIQRPLNQKYVKGILTIDYGSKLADFRHFPQFYNGKEIKTLAFMEYIDHQLSFTKSDTATSLLYHGESFLIIKIGHTEFYICFLVDIQDVVTLNKIGRWLIPYVKNLSLMWKTSSKKAIVKSLEILDILVERDTVEEILEEYTQMILRGHTIRPCLRENANFNIEIPSYLDMDAWEILKNLDCEKNLLVLQEELRINFVDLLALLEWARQRRLIDYLGE